MMSPQKAILSTHSEIHRTCYSIGLVHFEIFVTGDFRDTVTTPLFNSKQYVNISTVSRNTET